MRSFTQSLNPFFTDLLHLQEGLVVVEVGLLQLCFSGNGKLFFKKCKMFIHLGYDGSLSRYGLSELGQDELLTLDRFVQINDELFFEGTRTFHF